MAFADDYVGVHERIDSLFKKFPDARIQTEIAHLSDNLVVMKATVYRDAADTLPVIAHSQLGIPGKTNFTRDSEVENAETSAVGRALAFMGFETKKGISSCEEVASRRPAPADRAYGPPAASQRPTDVVLPPYPTPQFVLDFWKDAAEMGYSKADVVDFCAGDVTEAMIECWEKADLHACLNDLRKAKGQLALT